MGSPANHDIVGIKEKFGLTAFVETGTFHGDGMAHAISYGFDLILSVEIDEGLFKEVTERFKGPRNVMLFLGDSRERLPDMLKHVEKHRVLWWLDAHLNGGERFPLREELGIITQDRDVSGDVFILDDLRIYENGPFAHGEWKDQGEDRPKSADFVWDILGQTHTIKRDYRHEGYIVCLPMKRVSDD
jgi:hypothetical protein